MGKRTTTTTQRKTGYIKQVAITTSTTVTRPEHTDAGNNAGNNQRDEGSAAQVTSQATTNKAARAKHPAHATQRKTGYIKQVTITTAATVTRPEHAHAGNNTGNNQRDKGSAAQVTSQVTTNKTPRAKHPAHATQRKTGNIAGHHHHSNDGNTRTAHTRR